MSLIPKFSSNNLFKQNLLNTKNFDLLLKNFQNITFDHFNVQYKVWLHPCSNSEILKQKQYGDGG